MSTVVPTGRGSVWLQAVDEAASRAVRAMIGGLSFLERMAVVMNHLDEQRRTAMPGES
jgi:hypothetical protein